MQIARERRPLFVHFVRRWPFDDRRRRGSSWFGLFLLIAAAGSSCATPVLQPSLTFEQHTLRIPLAVAADGTVSLAECPPLMGRLDLVPILKAEGLQVAAGAKTVQLMVHYGRLYVVAEAFRSVWEITPQPGTSTATYRPIPVLRGSGQESLRDVRLSRYGSSRSSCLRLDRAGGRPVFITSKGEARDDCP